jgi:uncharacterized protein (TIGR02271 family)
VLLIERCELLCVESAMTKRPSPRPDEATEALPIVEEHLKVDKRRVETGRVRLRTVVDERLERVAEDLEREDVSIERVAVDQQVTQRPEIREENGVLIVPVCEEVLVIEKRLVVKEELHIRKNRHRERFEKAVPTRHMRVEVERTSTLPGGASSNEAPPARAGVVPAREAPAHAAASAARRVSQGAVPVEPVPARRRPQRKAPQRSPPK